MASPEILLVIDVQTCFFEGSSAVPGKEKLREEISRVLEMGRKAGSEKVRVIFIRHNEPGDPDFTPNTPSWELAPFLSATSTEAIIDKTKPNSFYETTLAKTVSKILGQGETGTERELKPNFTMIGLQSEFCVRATSTEAKKLYPDGRVRVVRGAHGTYESEGLSAEEVSRKIEEEIKGKGVEIVGVEELEF